MQWLVYILELADGTFYAGITNNLKKRLATHKSGKGSKYVRSRLPFGVVYTQHGNDRSEVTRREIEIKSLSRSEKEQLIAEFKERSKDMSFPIQPLFDRVFVKKADASQTKSGLHLTETVKGRAVTGTVVAAGPGLRSLEDGKFITPCVKVGDTVFVKEFTGYIVRFGGEEVHVFQENEIIGVVSEVGE